MADSRYLDRYLELRKYMPALRSQLRHDEQTLLSNTSSFRCDVLYSCCDTGSGSVQRKQQPTVLLRHGDKVIEISLPPATLQELGLGEEAGTEEEEEVSVVLVKRPASDKAPLRKR